MGQQWRDAEKDLVAEQPGLGLSLIGFFLAFFIGLAIRAAVSPDRVHEHLREATQSIHKDLSFEFQKAYVSFSDGFWPDLSVVIEGVRIESKNTCRFNPLAEINRIRLPLSVRHLLQGKILIHEILADEVNLSLREPFRECVQAAQAGPVVSRSLSQASGKKSEPTPSAMGRFENVHRENPIDLLAIAKLNIHYLPVAFTSFYIEDFQAKLQAAAPKQIHILGRFHLGGDSPSGDFGSFANLQIDLVEGAEPFIMGSLKGAWREGQYQILSKLDLKTQLLSLDSDIRQLPLSRIIPILKKYRLVESEFNGNRSWISGKIKTQGPLSEIKKTPIVLSNLKLEGDLGEITCKQLEIQRLEPFQVRPVELQVQGLNIKELLVFLNRPHPSPALGNLGVFNGSGTFVSAEQLSLRGDYSGLEFIFSNRGVRQIQPLSLVSGELQLKKNQWQIQVDRIKPVDGIFDGKVKMSADKDFKELEIEADIVELGLAPKIQTLMTGGGSLGALSGDLRIRLKAAQIEALRGQLKWDQLLVEGVKIYKPKAVIQTKNKTLNIKMTARELEVLPNSVIAPFFQSLLIEVGKPTSLLLNNPMVNIRTEKFQSLAWSQFQAQSSAGIFKSQGEWNEKAELSGVIQVMGSQPQAWDVRGTRNQPRFVPRNL